MPTGLCEVWDMTSLMCVCCSALLCGGVMGAQAEENAQNYKTAESEKCSVLCLFGLILRTGNLIKPPISWHE